MNDNWTFFKKVFSFLVAVLLWAAMIGSIIWYFKHAL